MSVVEDAEKRELLHTAGGNAKWKPRCVHAKSLGHIRLGATLWTAARQAPLPMAFSRQEYWAGLLCPPPLGALLQGIFPTQGWNLRLFCLRPLAGRFFPTSATWEALENHIRAP